MEYLIICSIIVILLFLVVHHFNKLKTKAKMEELRAAWGQPKTESFHFLSIRRYADLIKEKFHRLTDQTIEDIDFHRLFIFVDRTTSKVGQQFLFKKITEPTDLIEDPSEKLIQLVTKDKKLREEIQVELLKLNDTDAYFITSLLEVRSIEEPKWLFLLMLDLIIVVSLLILSFKFPVLLIALLFLTTLNMFIHYWNKSNTFQFTRSIPQFNVLINVSKKLIKKDELLFDKSVTESISQLKSFQQKASLIKFDNGIGSQGEFGELGKMVNDLIKAFFLIEAIVFFKVIGELKDKQTSIITLFNYVGNIDASISIASLRSGKLKTCQPVLTSSKKELVVKNIYHPLIKNCAQNNLTISDKSVLITGSNMSGKSTFLRTLAINSILAQTIYTCFADEYVSPILKQFSSIRIDDNIFEGKSYYFQEVNVMSTLLAEVNSSHQNLFILDEVFKGTNTVERIAAAKAILSYLNRNNNIVIVSTHDIELADMLSSEYELYHFSETIENDKLHFDHKIKPGQVKTRNGIKLLELSNYPAEIINEAQEISMRLRTTT
jgi:energy-coupling factor transporter ATP-binding protein EcfA2